MSDSSDSIVIAVVIPTLNEESCVEHTIRSLMRDCYELFIIVADCKSCDSTALIVEKLIDENAASSENQQDCIRLDLIQGEWKSRSQAMNAGAEHLMIHYPDVEVMLFLHADSILPENWPQLIRNYFFDTKKSPVAGAFKFAFQLQGIDFNLNWLQKIKLTFIGCMNTLRYRLNKIYFGDQGIFIRRENFEQVGGFPDVLLMEDVKMCRILKQVGHIGLIERRILTSPRRFIRHGILRQGIIDGFMLICETLGCHPEKMYRWYNRFNQNNHQQN